MLQRGPLCRGGPPFTARSKSGRVRHLRDLSPQAWHSRSVTAATGSTHDARPRLGRYELIGEIASGGMATVHLARAIGAKGFTRLVAIKKLHAHLEKDEEFVAMFLDEARLAAKIRHPNVVPTLDVEADDGLYLVMEYIEGDRLSELMRHAARHRQRIDPAIAMKMVFDALEGLHAAHELRDDDGTPLHLVHRDVSPQNIMVGVDGVSRIVDFGIAKAETRLSQTREGQLKGKLSYMAPEQMLQRDQIDRRVDVFAMGIVLWEALSSRRLFKGDSEVETLGAVLNEPIPSPRTVVPDLPDAIEAVVMQALERNPDDRFATAARFANELERASASVGGLASVKVVASYVQSVAGPKIERERWRLKSDHGAGAAPPPAQSSDERHGDEISTSAVRALAAGESRGPSLAERVADVRKSIGGDLADRSPPKRSPALFALIAVGIVSLVASVWMIARRTAPPPVTPATVAPAAAARTPVAPFAVAQPAAVPSAAVPPAVAPPAVAASTAGPVAPAGTPAASPVVLPSARRGTRRTHGRDPREEEYMGVNPYRR